MSSGLCSNREDTSDDGEGVAALVDLLREGDEDEKEVVAAKLWELSKNIDNRAPITVAGGIPPLVELVMAGNSKQREAAAGALWGLASITENQATIAALGGSRALVQLLRNGDTSEKAAAAGALRALAANTDNRAAISALGGVRDLLTLLRDSNTALKETVAGALWKLSRDSAVQRDIAALGGIEALVASIRDGSATEKENATGALWNLTYRSSSNQLKLLRCDGIQPLINLVISGTAREGVLAAGVLGFLYEHLNSDTTTAIDRGSKALLTFIQDQESTRKVDESLVALLGFCSADISAVRAGVAELDVYGILSTLFRGGTETTRNMSTRLLATIDGVAAGQPQLCSAMGEAEPLCQHVADRLQTLVGRGLVVESDTMRNQLSAILSMHGNKSTVARLVSAHALAEAIADLHRKLDALETESCKDLWKPQWETDRAAMKRQLFECEVSRMGSDLHDIHTQMEALGLLSHEVKQNKASYSKEERAFMRRAANYIMGFSQLKSPAHEPWFIPRHEIQLQDEPFARGGFGIVFKGKYNSSDVIVKNVKADLNDFLREVTVWREAGSFPNVVPFFGACHIGSPFMMVCKYISGGSLPHYLYEQKKMGRSSVWRALLGATHALQFLQSKGIVHGDLKADNILVDGDMAMLTDFGMSFFVSEGQPRFENMGAIYWRAPEMALYGKASFESDVYSLGTCIVEAVTGDIPWQGLDEPAVRFHLRQGKLFQKPRTMQKEVWDLVVDMCKFEPSERLSLDQVEERVGEFADDELEAEGEREGLANEKVVIRVFDMADLCSTMNEAEPLCRHVFERLRSLIERKVEPTSTGLMLSDFKSLMKQNAGKVAVLRLVGAHAVARALEALHREIDEFEPPSARGQWEVRWQNERAAMLEKLFGCDIPTLTNRLEEAAAQGEALNLLDHEIHQNKGAYTKKQRRFLKVLFDRLADFSSEGDRGPSGKVYHGKHMNCLEGDFTEKCQRMNEAGPLCSHVMERIITLEDSGVHSLSSVLNRLRALLVTYRQKKIVIRLVSARSLADTLAKLHRELDSSGQQASTGDWQPRWKADRDVMMKKLFECDIPTLINNVVDAAAHEEALTLLVHELKQRKSAYTKEQRAFLTEILDRLVDFLPGGISVNEKWFIPRTDVQVDDVSFNRGASGKVYHGKYMSADVVIKCVAIILESDQEDFLREVNVWHEASGHPNIVPFFGACHVGEPCFMVCKFIAGGTLPEYLYQQQKLGRSCAWRALLGTTHAIQFLHSKGIVYGDLKGANLLMEGDTAMITDFGMSFFAAKSQPDFANLGAIRWRAPEFIATKKASFEADVYSLGMCIVEAVTGKLPWGIVPDIAVKWHLNNNKFLTQPQSMSDEEWALVCAMCDFDPSKRMQLEEVERQIYEFSEWEADEEDARRRIARAAS